MSPEVEKKIARTKKEPTAATSEALAEPQVTDPQVDDDIGEHHIMVRLMSSGGYFHWCDLLIHGSTTGIPLRAMMAINANLPTLQNKVVGDRL